MEFFLLFSLLLLITLSLLVSLTAQGGKKNNQKLAFGGRASVPSPHIVIDTLNLTYWLLAVKENHPNQKKRRVGPPEIVQAINFIADCLKKSYPGRIMFVLKDRDSKFNSKRAREIYRKVADRKKVYIYLVERFAPNPGNPEWDKNENSSASNVVGMPAEHGSLGRDDYYMVILANRWKCAVLSADRLRDFNVLRNLVPPFHVYEFTYWREGVSREFITPKAPTYDRIIKPPLLRPNIFFKNLSKCGFIHDGRTKA